eukprot:4506863-Pyramimonas_sp.AAC.1
MPGVTDAATRVALEGAAVSLKGNFPNMFKTSERCLPPHLNMEVLKDQLFQVRPPARTRPRVLRLIGPS